MTYSVYKYLDLSSLMDMCHIQTDFIILVTSSPKKAIQVLTVIWGFTSKTRNKEISAITAI